MQHMHRSLFAVSATEVQSCRARHQCQTEVLSLQPARCRRAMLHHVLMPVLRFAPLAFQVHALQERASKLRDILSCPAASAPSLM